MLELIGETNVQTPQKSKCEHATVRQDMAIDINDINEEIIEEVNKVRIGILLIHMSLENFMNLLIFRN